MYSLTPYPQFGIRHRSHRSHGSHRIRGSGGKTRGSDPPSHAPGARMTAVTQTPSNNSCSECYF